MKTFKICQATLALAIVATLTGCSTASTNLPDVSAGIRAALDQAGLKDVSASQDREKGVVTLGGHVPGTGDKAQAESIARSLAPYVTDCPRGLRVCITGAEEWGLVGSRLWLERMDPRERDSMALDINLDSVGGAGNFTALTSGFANLDTWIRDTAARADLALATYLPLMANSDHASFATQGIPAVRLIAGFDAPDSHLRLLLTAADTLAWFLTLPAERQTKLRAGLSAEHETELLAKLRAG